MSFADSLGPSSNLLIIDMMLDGFSRTRIQVQGELILIKDRLNVVNPDHARKVDTGIESITYWCELLAANGFLEKVSAKPATYKIHPNLLVSDDQQGLMLLRKDALDD